MIWIFIPAFNEEQSIPRLLPKVAAVLQGQPYRLVIVNDGSLDDTASVIKEAAGNLPIEVITHTINRGLGETERDGFEFIASKSRPEDPIIRVEADDTHEPEYILSLIQKLDEGYDVVNTSRFQPGGGQVGVDAYREMISKAANLFMRFLFRIPGTRDYSCGYRAYRSQIIQDAIAVFGNHFIQLRGLGFTSTLEMIVKLHLLGARFAEIPFVLRYDQKQGQSKMVSSITTVGYFLMAFLYHWPFGGWRNQYRGLAKLYREDPRSALDRYSLFSVRQKMTSRISF